MSEKKHSTAEVAARFNELAKQEKWFEIQEEFFSDDVKSIDPPHSPWFGYAEGKKNVREKGETFVKGIVELHGASTSEPMVAENHFVVQRSIDVTTSGFGRVQLNQLMMYEVKDGKIISEQFFY